MSLFKESKSSRLGFTMVELMLAMVILSIGIAALLRSFLTVVNALALTSDKIEAVSLLDGRAAKLQEQALVEGGLRPKMNQENVLLANTKAVYQEQVLSFEAEDLKKPENIDEVSKRLNLTEAILTVSWDSSMAKREQTITTAFFEANKDEKQD